MRSRRQGVGADEAFVDSLADDHGEQDEDVVRTRVG